MYSTQTIMASSLATSNQFSYLNKMHQNLQTRLASCQYLSELSPFIEMLFDTNELKQQLSKLLEQQYQKERITNPSPPNKIRSLYIETNQMQSIPSMDVQAHILSYLSQPEFELSGIHLVSKQFNQIMNRYAHIYNDNNYTLEISDANGDTSKGWRIEIDHNDRQIFVDRKADNEPLLKQQIPTPFNQIKRWNVHHHHDDNKGNKYIINALQNNANHIHTLNLKCVSPIANNCLPESSVSFPNCKVLTVNHYIQCTNMFSKLRRLDLILPTKDANRMLEYLPKCLLFLSLSLYNNTGEIIKIPSNIQWLKTEGKEAILYNLNECKQLIGWRVSHNIVDVTLQNAFLWPIRYVIPLVQITSTAHNRRGGNIYMRKTFPARLVYWILEAWAYFYVSDAYNGMILSDVEKKLNTFSDDEKLVDPRARWFIMKGHSSGWTAPTAALKSNDVLEKILPILKLFIADESERENAALNLREMIKLKECRWIQQIYRLN
eukprot:136887_1